VVNPPRISDEDEGEGYDAAEKPFDFIEEEGKSALVCESDSLIREKIRPSLEIMEYHTTEVPNSREALKKMRYHNYDLIIINEYFDTQDPDANPLLIYLERMLMETRRNIYVTLITSRFRTMDYMIAFQKSVNMVLNIRNIDDFDKIIQRGMADFGLFYKVFKESLTH
jgi:CheY-like chemotaxis protein